MPPRRCALPPTGLARLRRAVARAARVRPVEWLDLARAEAALLAAALSARVRRTGRLVEPAPPAAAPRPNTERATVDRWVRAVNRAATYGPFRARCLVKSLALHRLLRRAGVSGTSLKIGVRWEAGAFAAHAWVEYAGDVLTDDHRHVGFFHEMVDIHERPHP